MEHEVHVQPPGDMDAVRRLWAQYWDEHREDLGAQDLAAEAERLPEGYAGDDGAILVALDGDDVLGTVAMRRFDQETCEMKRLYVPEERRGQGVGHALVEGIMDAARDMGFARMVLDTTESMAAARALYRKHGFRDADGFDHSPCEGPVYMIRDL